MPKPKQIVKINVELKFDQFYCEKCETIHTKNAYALAQEAMRVPLVFTCSCGNKINL